MSRLELETPKAVTQNSRRTLANQCPSPHTQIATYCDGCPFRLIHGCLLLVLQFPTRLFVVIQTFTPSPQAYTVSYDVIRYHALLFISAHFSSYCCSFL